jgi:hypothetical protein
LGQQLQRLRIVGASLGCKDGVNAVAYQRQSQGCHVHAQLVALAGDGF